MGVVPEYSGADGWDDPEAYLAADRRDALRAGVSIPERVRGAGLFADLSGFTPLTEAMHAEYGSSRGAEQLTAALDTIFTAVLDELHRHGGNVVYFSGDAVTCWLEGDDGRLAVACASAMQRAIGQVQEIVLPSGRTFRIGLKITVAVGAARRFVVGDPDIQLIDVLAGRLIDYLAAAESVAAQGEVVLDESALDALGDAVVISEIRKSAERRCGVLESLAEAPTLPTVRREDERLPDDVIRPWLLPPVWERLRTGHGEFLAELRLAIPIFVRFGGLDFDNDDGARDRLDAFIRGAQQVIDGYGGAALQLTLGDKGAYLYGVFGSPVAHEDDAARACAAAIDLLALAATGSGVTDLQIGIAQGRLRSGTYGHPSRRTFCCLGDAVNLAARLMSAAAPGQIVVADEVQRAAGNRFSWTRLPDFSVKGKRRPVIAHALDGRQARRGERSHVSALVGRQDELARLTGLLDEAMAGSGQVVGVCAEAGLGKSRLLGEVAGTFGARGVACYTGEAQPFGSRTSYFAWTQIWTSLLDVPEGTSDERLAAVTASVQSLAPDLLPRVPLLGSLVDSEFPDSDLTRSFDAKLRKTSLETLAGEILTAMVAARGPLILVLEDCHWLDPVSADLLNTVARLSADLPLAVLLAYRPLDEADTDARVWYDAVSSLPHWSELVLDELTESATRELIAGEAARLFELDAAPTDALIDTVLARSGGNPFHVQELLTYLWSQHVDPQDDAAVAAVDLPASLHALVLSRID
ncbi:MAG TPA: adenylate/guanylate cyclase domain-containing protein, partial [Jatrophihabitans sp.]|nr:adenylate/guanylate cyclase domain-containing protein [Jatrophihabitans sp.]